MRYAFLIAYDGTGYGGWQIQTNAVTVQQKLTEAAFSVFGKKVNFVASGRTDSGVHAAGQVCHADVETNIPAEKIADALNARLPEDIRVLKSVQAFEEFDATASAKRKTYCYKIYLSARSNPLKDRYAVQIKFPVDIEKLTKAAKLFIGEHDFKAYCAAGSSVKTTVRKIYSIEVKTKESRGSVDADIYVTGNGFLYNMVRTLAGTLIYFAAGKISEDDILRSIDKTDRNAVGKTMPAKGLTLECVDYGKKLF